MKITIGNEYKMIFPFYKTIINGLAGNGLFSATVDCSFWNPGCEMNEEDDGGPTPCRFFNAHDEGLVIYKVLSVAEMPGKYQDRIIFKRWLIDPDGKKYNNGEVRMLTTKSFIKDVSSVTPFKADYEVI